jgi:hypothetical protein
MTLELLNPWALYGLAALVPIIILYLLKPKPKKIEIPSLMFIVSIEQKKRFSSFFRRILRDPLLILQILIIFLLVLAAANPILSYLQTREVSESIAIVIDVSASMSSRDTSATRFSSAISNARNIVADMDSNDEVSIILAENIPIILLRSGDKDQALSTLNSVMPKATPTGTGNAILLARDVLESSKLEKTIYILSDFSNFEGTDPTGAIKSATSVGINIVPIAIGQSGQNNIAIIAAKAYRDGGSCVVEAIIRNFYLTEKNIPFTVFLDSSNVGSSTVSIDPDGTAFFSMPFSCSSSEHEVKIKTDLDDSLLLDNIAHLIVPSDLQIRVALVKEKENSDFVGFALSSLDNVDLQVFLPEIFPNLGDFDVLIIQNIKSSSLLPGTYKEVDDFVSAGGSAILIGGEELLYANSEYLPNVIPVELLSVSNIPSRPITLFEHPTINDINLEELSLEKHITAEEKEGTVTIASIYGSPFLAYKEHGNGNVLYIGIGSNASWGNFNLKPSFPIFWLQTIGWLTRDQTLGNSLNFNTGDQLPLMLEKAVSVITPSGVTIKSTNILLDEAGIYTIKDLGKRVSSNLFNEQESDTAPKELIAPVETHGQYQTTKVEEETYIEFFWIFAIIALLLTLFEWFYYKRRGSI